MIELKENQLLLLDNLIYLKGVADLEKDVTVSEVVNRLLDQHIDDEHRDEDLEYAMDDKGNKVVLMEYDEWVTVLRSIQHDPDLMNLTITQARDDYGDNPDKGGMRVACFVGDDNDDATVVFRGTGGPMEWHDNGVAAYTAESQQQEEALRYIEGLTDYDNITVTGHSKGGNKAQYVAIMSDKVDRCVSFDGQGFSMEFMAKYKDVILENSYKITSISDEYDFVNCLLFPLPLLEGKRKYTKSEFAHVDFKCNHCPNTMLDEDGQLNNFTDSSIITKLVSSLTQYAIATMKEPNRSYVVSPAMKNIYKMEEFGKQSANI